MKGYIGVIIGIIILCIVEPIIIFGAGWFGGWILMKIVAFGYYGYDG